MSVWKPAAITAGSAVTLLAAGAAWTQVERKSPTLRTFTVAVDVPSYIQPLRILQVADPHFYPGQEHLVDFVKSLADLDFDLVIATGDNLGAAEGFDMLAEAFEPLLDRPGVFVLGSNDYYSPRRKRWSSYLTSRKSSGTKRTERDLPWFEMTKLFTDAGWLDLTNQSEILELSLNVYEDEDESASSDATGDHLAERKIRRAQRIGFIGVDDPHIHRDRIPAVPDNWADPDMYRIGVTHAPYQRVLNEYVSLGVHAIFAGHTHGGQLCLPFYGAIVTNCDLPRPYARGLHTWGFGGNSAALHVSAGLGNSPYAPVRFSCQPEASLITLAPLSNVTLGAQP